MTCAEPLQPSIRTALQRLGIERLVLSIHQASFPPSDDDLGYGTPHSARGGALIAWLAGLGFTGVSLGPAGITSRNNPSPYDATGLSRNPLHIALGPLCQAGWLDPQRLEAAVAGRPSGERVAYEYAWVTQRRLLAEVLARRGDDPALREGLARLRQAAPWLDREAWFEAVVTAVGHDDWRQWPDAPPTDAQGAREFLLGQLLVREQHAAFCQRSHACGIRVYADLPIGTSHREQFLFRERFLAGYAMGAPPSRTNPEGQPWGYAVLDPAQLEPGGAAWHYAATRLDAVLQDHDGVRIDHPHGWICPWVYRTDDPDPLRAVQQGARLFESPDLPDHPALAALARVRADQIDHAQPRHADDWVRRLEPDQVVRYAQPFDLIIERLLAQGHQRGDLLVEVLSTCPRPLAEVLARHQLGRYRVTQKADLTNPQDVYRSDLARPEDWIMVGTHDTPPLRAVLARWEATDELPRRAAYLAGRLARSAGQRAELADRCTRDPADLTTAMFADLFCGPARNVLIFWADLFGLSEIYNRPGVRDADNWSLRVPADFERVYGEACRRRTAPDLARALAWALRARELDQDAEGQALVAALERGCGGE